MSWQLRKFPRTPHFPGSTGADLKTERVLTAAQAERLLQEPVIVEEKVDGANLGISFEASRRPILQSRGAVVERGHTAPQFAPLYAWLAPHQDALFEVLGTSLTLFGEWLYARHSVPYDALTDFFLAFDVLEREAGAFQSVAKRAEICERARVCQVPLLFEGVLGSFSKLQQLLGDSRCSKGSAEGVYVRLERDGHLELRAKLVRSGWVPAEELHWSKRPLERNKLALVAECRG